MNTPDDEFAGFRIEDLLPGKDDRMFITGRSGTGKTTFALDVVAACINRGDQLLAIDSKREKKWPTRGYTVCTRSIEVLWAMRLNKWPILWRVNPDEFDDPRIYEPVLRAVFKRKNMTCYIDELMTFTRSNPPLPRAITLLYAQGRSYDICMIAGSQRPALIPTCCVTESSVFAAFGLNRRDDQRTIQEMIYYDPSELHRYEFWYGNLNTEESFKGRLDGG